MPETTAADAAQDQEAEIELTLQEYCLRKSRSDRRVEMIGAFHHKETAQGTIKAMTSEFEARFDAFVNQPV